MEYNFQNQLKTLNKSIFIEHKVNTFIIPNSITEIGSYAFSGCLSLLGIIIPNNNDTEINDGTFSQCFFSYQCYYSKLC